MSSSPTQSATNGAGRPLTRQDHVRGSAESLVTKVYRDTDEARDDDDDDDDCKQDAQ